MPFVSDESSRAQQYISPFSDTLPSCVLTSFSDHPEDYRDDSDSEHQAKSPRPRQRERGKRRENGRINHVFNIYPGAPPPQPHGYPERSDMRHRGHKGSTSQGLSQRAPPLPQPERTEPPAAYYHDSQHNEQQPAGLPSTADILNILFRLCDACFSSTRNRSSRHLLAVLCQTSFIPNKVVGWGIQILLIWVCSIWTAGFVHRQATHLVDQAKLAVCSHKYVPSTYIPFCKSGDGETASFPDPQIIANAQATLEKGLAIVDQSRNLNQQDSIQIGWDMRDLKANVETSDLEDKEQLTRHLGSMINDMDDTSEWVIRNIPANI